MSNITVEEVKKLIKEGSSVSIVDVREVNELLSGKIPGARHIPLGHLLSRRNELDKDMTQILVCASGHRSQLGAFLLRRYGYKVFNMQGGMNAWEGDLE